MSTAHLEIVVDSTGVRSAGKDLQQFTGLSKEAEKQSHRFADVFSEIAAAEEKEAKKAVALANEKIAVTKRASDAAEQSAKRAADASARAAQRENEAWNDAKQRALAAADRKAEAAEKSAQRQIAAAEKAAKREDELWNNAIQRAKAGLDGVLPIRPSLQRIEAKINEPHAGVGAGLKEGATSALGLGVLAGGAAGIAAAGAEKLFDIIAEGKAKVIETAIEMDNLKARIAGVTGGAETASEKFEELESMTLGKLPSSVKEVSDSFIQLSNVGLNSSSSALRAYSNIAAQTGHSLGDVTQAVQMATMGNFRSLREFGVKVKDEGDNLKVTFRGQTETVANSAEAIEGYLQQLGAVQFAGAVERQMDTIGGAVKKQHDAWERLIDNVANSSLGALIEKSVGASTSIIDAMTASVDALFDRVQKGKRELESEKRSREESAALDKTMIGWADPSASRAEINRLAESLEAHSQSSADKALALYTKNAALIDKLETLGEAAVGDMTLAQARSENERQYRREAGGEGKAASKGVVLFDAQTEALMAYEQRQRDQAEKDKETLAQQIAAVKSALAKQADNERESYESRKKVLAQYFGPDSEELWAANAALWEKHLDDIAEKSAKAQIALQSKLAGIGVGPQSQFQAINNKTAGAHYELGAALADNLSGKNGDALKLEAEHTYSQKSIAIERQRTAEIARLSMELAQQSAQNAEAMFGNLAEASKNWGGEQSKIYQSMFAAQKAFGIASAGVSMAISIGKAAELGWPAGIPAGIEAAAQGAKVLAMISNQSYSGSHDSGGNIQSGSYGEVGERRPELLMVHGRSRVQGPASVLGGEATAALLSGGSRQPLNVRVVNAYDGDAAVSGFLGSTRGELVLRNFVKRNGPLIRSITR